MGRCINFIHREKSLLTTVTKGTSYYKNHISKYLLTGEVQMESQVIRFTTLTPEPTLKWQSQVVVLGLL